MSEEQIKIEKDDKILIRSHGRPGKFMKVYEAKSLDGKKRPVCIVEVDGKEYEVEMNDVELLEKAPPPRPVIGVKHIPGPKFRSARQNKL